MPGQHEPEFAGRADERVKIRRLSEVGAGIAAITVLVTDQPRDAPVSRIEKHRGFRAANGCPRTAVTSELAVIPEGERNG
jgi:hypothetical protein